MDCSIEVAGLVFEPQALLAGGHLGGRKPQDRGEFPADQEADRAAVLFRLPAAPVPRPLAVTPGHQPNSPVIAEAELVVPVAVQRDHLEPFIRVSGFECGQEPGSATNVANASRAMPNSSSSRASFDRSRSFRCTPTSGTDMSPPANSFSAY